MDKLIALSLGLTLFFTIHPSKNVGLQHSESIQQRDSVRKMYPKTIFQTGHPWNPDYDIRADAALVYGMNKTFSERAASWRSHGYLPQFMTGIAWGNYQNYFDGQFDGKTHYEDGQVQRNGKVIGHGKNVPYVVPTLGYVHYFKTVVKKVIDDGVQTIYLEEPEFWARAGYSKSFKKEWKNYYGISWEPQYKSAQNAWFSAKLKHHLYIRALRDVLTFAKNYGRKKGLHIKCFVATHSLLNYSIWRIVSPEASINDIKSVDGVIGQVWTGTSQTPIYYNNIYASRTFVNAYLEYGSVYSMFRSSGKLIYFLTDPVEDNPNKSWNDYRKRYEATFTAEVLYPQVDHYEVMPWPNRIYEGKHKRFKNSKNKVRIPAPYATQIQVMIDALHRMSKSGNRVNGSQGISVLAGNSMMYQRVALHGTNQNDRLSNYYGLTLPWVYRGVPVQTVLMSNLKYRMALKNTKVLLMTYANMKPLSPKTNQYLAKWVKKGGVLIYVSRDNDPYEHIKEWWNTGKYHFKTASEDLFNRMDLPHDPGSGAYAFGKGTVYVVRKNPSQFVLKKNGDLSFVKIVNRAYKKETGRQLVFKNYFQLKRGPYDIISVMENKFDVSSKNIKGSFVDLFKANLPVTNSITIHPGHQALLYDLHHLQGIHHPEIIAAAARISHKKTGKNTFHFVARGPLHVTNTMRIYLPGKPEKITAFQNGTQQNITELKSKWDQVSHTCLITFPNNPKGIQVSIRWQGMN